MWIDILRNIDVQITRCMLRAYKAGSRVFVHERHVQFILDRGAGRVSERQPQI